MTPPADKLYFVQYENLDGGTSLSIPYSTYDSAKKTADAYERPKRIVTYVVENIVDLHWVRAPKKIARVRATKPK